MKRPPRPSRPPSRSPWKARLFRAALAFLAAGGVLVSALLLLLIAEFRPSRDDDDREIFRAAGHDYEIVHFAMVRQRFPIKKAEGTLRVFVVGSSQAMGTPYVHQDHAAISRFLVNEGGVSTWIAAYLRAAMPGRRVEVINAAKGGRRIADHRQTVEEIVEKGDPDMIVFLAGNNESGLPEIGPDRALADGASIERAVASIGRAVREELDRVAEAAGRRGVPVYLLTVPTNVRDWRPTDARGAAEAEISRLVDVGRYGEALEALGEGPETPNALRLYLRARCLDRLGDFARAKPLYERARDLDRNFFRCRGPWNDEIRRTRGPTVRVLDAEKIMAAHARDGLPGFDLFHDYCHFTLEGNQKLAWEIVSAYLGDRGFAADRLAALRTTKLPDIAARQRKWLYWAKFVKWLRYKYGARGLDESEKSNIDAVLRRYEDHVRAPSR